MNLPEFQIFGSKSSKDYDVLVFVDELRSIDDNHSLIKDLNKFLSLTLPSKPINCNLGILKDGILVNVFKGTYDEVNNSLYQTYDLHKEYQVYENRIVMQYHRFDDQFKHLKLKRCYRFLLSFYSRTMLRNEIKEALRGNFKVRLDVLKKIDFRIHTEFPGKKDAVVDIYKVIAFQLAQTIGLFQGLEIYTKEDAAKYFPELEVFLLRQEHNINDLYKLDVLLLELLEIGEREIHNMKNLEEEIMGQ